MWPSELKEHANFRSITGLAMVAYAVYIKDSISRNDFKQALIQCADAYSLISLDQEKKAHERHKYDKRRIEELPRLVMSEKGKNAVKVKLANDPKQQEKMFVYSCWATWQSDVQKYPSQAAFARDMLTKCEHLTSQKKIEDWCRAWGRTTGTLPAG